MIKIVKIMRGWRAKMVMGWAVLSLMMVNSALAAPVDEVTKPIMNFVDIIMGIAGAIGAGVLGWGIISIAMAIHSEQTSEVSRHLKTVAAGALLISAGVVLKIVLG